MVKTLLYSCVFYADNYINLVSLLLKSYRLFGNSPDDVDYLIMCDPDLKQKVQAIFDSLNISGKIWCINLAAPARDAIDGDGYPWSIRIFEPACSRLKIFEYPDINLYSKILYLDCDILVTDSINKILGFQLEDKLYALEEGNTNHPFFGSEFFDENPNCSAFSSGILLFNNNTTIKNLFSQILLHIRNHVNNNLPIPGCLDQPFIVYNAIINNLYDNQKLINVVINNPTDFNGETISHFPGGPGNYGSKIVKMSNFMNNVMFNMDGNRESSPVLGNNEFRWGNSIVKLLDDGKMDAPGPHRFKVSTEGEGRGWTFSKSTAHRSFWAHTTQQPGMTQFNILDALGPHRFKVSTEGEGRGWTLAKSTAHRSFWAHTTQQPGMKQFNILDAFGQGRGPGEYKFINEHLLKCDFDGREHLLKLNENYSRFVSVRKSDFEVVSGDKYERKLIPKIIMQTAITKPERHLINAINQKCPGWEYVHFVDSEIIQYFKENPNKEFPNIIDKFNSFSKGQHKADLFRYYYLYLNGGIFMDSDAIVEVNVDDIIKSYDSVFVKSFMPNNHLFNGFIATYPKNPIIYDALRHAYETEDIALQENYHYLCEELWRIYNRHLPPNVEIYQEHDRNHEGYGGSIILDGDGEKIISHYWQSKKIPTPIFTDKTIRVGSSHHNNKEIILPSTLEINNLKINNIPVNDPDLLINDAFLTKIINNKLVVSRVDIDSGWGQDLVLEYYHNPIPKKIFQTWNNKNLGTLQKYSDSWKKYNLNYEYHLFDDKDCLNFLEEFFNPNIVNCYNRLLAPAHKCDLFRLCYLYIHGGIYADIDSLCMQCLDNFIAGDVNFVVPIGLNMNQEVEGKHNLFNGFIASSPNNIILKKAIDITCNNINNNNFPKSVLDFCGPGVLGRAVNWYLNKNETASFIGMEGLYKDICFLKFGKSGEYVSKDSNILFQNKNGNWQIIEDYNYEISQIKDYICWCSTYKNGNFDKILMKDTNYNAYSRKILLYNGFPFHFEMFGCVLDYAKKHNLDVDVVNTTDDGHQWFSLYQKYFTFNLYRDLSVIDIKCYKSVILLTDDDFSFPKELVSENIICINHFHESRRNDIKHQLPITKFNEGINNYCFPIWNCISREEKLNALKQNNKPIITLIGTSNIFETNNIKRIIENYQDFEFRLINRWIPHDIPSFIKTYENSNSAELFNTLNQTSYVLYLPSSSHINSIDQQNNRAISGSFPLAISNGCHLIIPNGMMKPLDLKSVIYYDTDKPIQLNKITNPEKVFYDRDRLTEMRNRQLDISMLLTF